jgi:hypothetical protein
MLLLAFRVSEKRVRVGVRVRVGEEKRKVGG